MKIVTCIISEDLSSSSYLFTFSCLKIKGKEVFLVNNFSKTIEKKDMNNEDKLKIFINSIGRTLNKYHFLYVNLYYSYSISSVFLLKFNLPKLSQSETKKTLELEMNKRIINYNDNYQGFVKSIIDENNKESIKVLSIEKKILNFPSIVFNKLPVKAKKYNFLFDCIRQKVIKEIQMKSFCFIYINSTYQYIMFFINKEINSLSIYNTKYRSNLNEIEINDFVKKIIINYGSNYQNDTKDIVIYLEMMNNEVIKEQIQEKISNVQVTLMKREMISLDSYSLISKNNKEYPYLLI